MSLWRRCFVAILKKFGGGYWTGSISAHGHPELHRKHLFLAHLVNKQLGTWQQNTWPYKMP